MRWMRCYWTQVNNMQVLVQDNHNVKTQSSSYSFVPEVRLTRAHESKFSFHFLSEDYTLPRGLNTAIKDATTFCQIKAMVLWHAPKQRNLGLNWDLKRCQPGAKHQSDPYFDTQSYKQRRGDHRERARTWNSAPQAGSPFTFFSLSRVCLVHFAKFCKDVKMTFEVLNEVYLQNFLHRWVVNRETNLMMLINSCLINN